MSFGLLVSWRGRGKSGLRLEKRKAQCGCECPPKFPIPALTDSHFPMLEATSAVMAECLCRRR